MWWLGKSGAKTVPRNSVNKNTLCKNSGFMRFFITENIEKIKKNAIQIPWGGRTVGSGRVAAIIV